MPSLVPGIPIVFAQHYERDGRDEPGHDESRACMSSIIRANHSAAAALAARSAATRLSTQRTDQTEPS
jgi:hypothetical protein